MSDHDLFRSPLVTRYASREMAELFGERHRVRTWREIWLALAEAQRKAGLRITQSQLQELRRTIDRIDFDRAAKHEKRLRHDVMAHVHAWGDLAPRARGVLHLGATSADIVDNADLMIMRDALQLIAVWLANAIDALAAFMEKYRSLPALGFTHYQPAQPTTVGKRAALWCADFVRDLGEIDQRLRELRFRGIKGATGTQASFLKLLRGDARKVISLENEVARSCGFDRIEPITGQTYSRKIDAQVVSTLGQIAASVHKFANDIRLLSNLKEINEPFEESQIGSSAMPYKRNPILCERATGLARFVISLVPSALQTAAEQWFERTLDDSAHKRLCIPEAFLATEAMLRIVSHVARGLVVFPPMIAARLRAELPSIATENILMAATSAGGDRQELHERLRRHAIAAADRVKTEGVESDLLDRLKSDPAFANIELDRVLDPVAYVGRAPEQVQDFLRKIVTPIRRRYADDLGREIELDV
ncbi:MAG: adenylosuccinate lyase [Planctomycetota bacterium]